MGRSSRQPLALRLICQRRRLRLIGVGRWELDPVDRALSRVAAFVRVPEVGIKAVPRQEGDQQTAIPS